ncbi:MerR family transcriptional regulator [Streptomyces sp. KM273126]|uniref:MerR family transcriptional regulator n=1 Tax=Streptomyces sp. KM273126 TaxID=2545247 RepID=UPI00103C25CB|nr:MerR family transcriptional regulator [Streptomyces sp. KM273126]MBA2811524.1 MerR family transcriptional regulator [Streptomyces sp. KM273126]
MSTILISQLAERTGVRPSTLRFYEKIGLLPATRSAHGYRLYGEDAVERLAFIATAKQLGLPLEEIADLLTIRDAGDCVDVKTELRTRLDTRIGEAQQHITGLGTFITTLRTVVERLDGLPSRTGPCDPACDALTSVEPGHPQDTEDSTAPAEDTPRWRASPVACSLTYSSLGERTKRWHALLSGSTAEPIDDGLRLTLPIEHAATLTELAVAEQECCPFYDFRIQLDGSSMHLEVRSPEEGAAILAELFTPTS